MVVRAAITLAALVAVFTLGGDVDAFPYVVKSGDGLAVLAERFYGRVDLERVLVAANRLDDGRGGGLVPGMRLEVPAVGYHKVTAGETWQSIAATELGSSRRGEVLARVHRESSWEQPAVGREIMVPYPLRYVATRGDTLESVAYRFLGKRDDAWVIQSFNGLEKAALEEGQAVLVPLVDLPLTEAGKMGAREAGALVRSEGGGKARERQELAERELATLAGKVRLGAYVEAIALGSGVLGSGMLGRGELTEPQLARVHAALTEAYVAIGAKGLAADACTAWRKSEPKLELDPNRYSPKILAACTARPGAEPSGGDEVR